MKRTTLVTLFLAASFSLAAKGIIPCAQYRGSEAATLKSVSAKNCAILEISLTGSDVVNSVNIKSADGRMISGTVEKKGKVLSVKEGRPFVELLCTISGEDLSLGSTPVTLKALIAPGDYPAGLDITVVSAAHRVMNFNTGAVKAEAGKIVSAAAAFVPDPAVLFYEGFDTFTGTEAFKGERPLYYQSDDFKKALVAPVAKAEDNTLNDDELQQLGLLGYYSLFRVSDAGACARIGWGKTRGILRTGPCFAIDGIRSVKASVDIRIPEGFKNEIGFKITNGGYVTAARVDGIEMEGVSRKYDKTVHNVIIGRKVCAALADGRWHKVELDIDRATDGMDITLMTEDLKSQTQMFFVDNLVVTDVRAMDRGKLRVLYWNIQNGMWYDQHNNYDNFVKWVKKYDPDVCVWCEAASIYIDKTDKKSKSRYLPANWNVLASRYGHSYSALGEHIDNYPQEITSKYPIKTIDRIGKTDDPKFRVAHGAAIQQIEVDGKVINIVTMHTYPQAFRWGIPKDNKALRDSSARAGEGDYYRAEEMKYVVAHSVNDPRYEGHADWLLMGDLNSPTRADAAHFKKIDAKVERKFLCQDEVRRNTDLKDIIGETYPGDFMSSTQGNSRIDNMYASPSMFARVKNAMFLVDSWTGTYKSQRSPYVQKFYEPSDHRPILVDFDW
ncbi:MAG: metal-dependent hydrolase [Bacteroidales bacterium]|nr:metal-dependent hydrolase [Bacteroidales bacterium]